MTSGVASASWPGALATAEPLRYVRGQVSSLAGLDLERSSRLVADERGAQPAPAPFERDHTRPGALEASLHRREALDDRGVALDRPVGLDHRAADQVEQAAVALGEVRARRGSAPAR